MNKKVYKTYKLKLPGAIYSGENAMDALGEIVGDKYKKIALFTDQGILRAGVIDKPLSLLQKTGTQILVLDELPSEPVWEAAQEITDRCLEFGAELIVAVGGGSVMDVAKLASVMGGENVSVKALLHDSKLCKKRIPTVMIPTTAGTGAEATPNCILAVPEKEVKVGIVSEEMMADYVILDRETIQGLPPAIAAATGVDALCHALECYTSKKATPFSDLFAMEALRLIIPNIEKACLDTRALEEKEKMLLASFYAGAAITASGTTGVHALSYPLGGKYHIPHGTANAMMLLPVMKYNAPCCQEEFARIYDVCLSTYGGEDYRGGDISEREKALPKGEKTERLLKWLEELLKKLPLELSLEKYGIGEEELETLVRSGMEVQRLLANNKREITEQAAKDLYQEAIYGGN